MEKDCLADGRTTDWRRRNNYCPRTDPLGWIWTSTTTLPQCPTHPARLVPPGHPISSAQIPSGAALMRPL